MKRYSIGLVVFSIFILFYFIMPFVFFSLGVESEVLYASFRLASVIIIPILMYKSFDFILHIKIIALLLFLIAISFFLIDISYLPIPKFVLGTCSVILLVSMPYMFVSSLIMKQAHFFNLRVGIYMMFLTGLLMLRRVTTLSNIGLNVGYDYGSYIGNGLEGILGFIIVREFVFIVYIIVEYLILDSIILEKNGY